MPDFSVEKLDLLGHCSGTHYRKFIGYYHVNRLTRFTFPLLKINKKTPIFIPRFSKTLNSLKIPYKVKFLLLSPRLLSFHKSRGDGTYVPHNFIPKVWIPCQQFYSDSHMHPDTPSVLQATLYSFSRTGFNISRRKSRILTTKIIRNLLRLLFEELGKAFKGLGISQTLYRFY